MTCDRCGKQATRLRGLTVDGKFVMGCTDCMRGKNPSRLSTEKRWYSGQGHDFQASPAHIDHIRHRRVAEDGRSVVQYRR